MPKDVDASSSQSAGKGGLVYLKYTYHYRNQFGELDDEWLEAIESTCDEMLGAFTKPEDEALNLAFGGWGKRRLNRVFDVIGFIYLDYSFPMQRIVMKRKSAPKTSSAPKLNKVKTLTHRPRTYYIERAAELPTLPATEASKAKSTEIIEVGDAPPKVTNFDFFNFN
jgi:hypothetical protein